MALIFKKDALHFILRLSTLKTEKCYYTVLYFEDQTWPDSKGICQDK